MDYESVPESEVLAAVAARVSGEVYFLEVHFLGGWTPLMDLAKAAYSDAWNERERWIAAGMSPDGIRIAKYIREPIQ